VSAGADSAAPGVPAARVGPVALGRAAREYLPPVAVGATFVALWYLVIAALRVPPYIVPPPGAVIAAAVKNWAFLSHALLRTFLEAIGGFLLSIAVGVSASLVMAQSRVIERSLYPYAVILQTIPVVAIAPVIIVWFGPGVPSIVTVSFILAVFPVISNTTLGLVSTDHNLVNLMELNDASRAQMLLKLKIPYALPYIMGGLRIASGMSVIGAIVGEFVGGVGGVQGGLGYLIVMTAGMLQMAYLFAAALASCALGIAMFFLMNACSYLLLRHWHESSMQREN
jgi:NitT/TauT family transport system permease protein